MVASGVVYLGSHRFPTEKRLLFQCWRDNVPGSWGMDGVGDVSQGVNPGLPLGLPKARVHICVVGCFSKAGSRATKCQMGHLPIHSMGPLLMQVYSRIYYKSAFITSEHVSDFRELLV